MKCVDKKKLMEFLDGELDARESPLVEKHLRECEDCTGYLQEMKNVVGLFQGLTTEKAPPQLRDRIQNQMKSSTLRFSSISYSLRPFFAMAAALLLFVMAGYFWYGFGVLKDSSLSPSELSKAEPKKERTSKGSPFEKSLVPPSGNAVSDPLLIREKEDKSPQRPQSTKTHPGRPSTGGRIGSYIEKKNKKNQSENKAPREDTDGKGQTRKDLASKDEKKRDEKKEVLKKKTERTEGDRGGISTGSAGGKRDFPHKEIDNTKALEGSKLSRADREKIERSRRKAKSPGILALKKELPETYPTPTKPGKKTPSLDSLSGYLQNHPQAFREILLLSSNLTRARKELLKAIPSGATLQRLRFGLNETQILKFSEAGETGRWPYQCMLFEIKVPSSKTVAFLMGLERLPSLRYFPGTSPRHFVQLQQFGNPEQASNQGEIPKASNPASPQPSKKPALGTKAQPLSKISLKIWIYLSQ